MKQQRINFSRRYAASLRKQLLPGSGDSLQPAGRLGRQAVVLGLKTLDLARIHERSVAALEPAWGPRGRSEQAAHFFQDALIPLLEAHHAMQKARNELGRLLSIRHEARGKALNLNKELATAQRVVAASARSARRVARRVNNT